MSTYTFLNPTFADITSATGLTTSAMKLQTGNTSATAIANIDNITNQGGIVLKDAPSAAIKSGIIVALLSDFDGVNLDMSSAAKLKQMYLKDGAEEFLNRVRAALKAQGGF